MTFEEELIQTVQTSVLREVQKASFLNIPYNDRKVIPKEVLENLWESVNWDEVIEQLRTEMQKRICNAIIGSMEKEIKTDVKNILSIDGIRQKLRVNVYPELMKVLNDVE